MGRPKKKNLDWFPLDCVFDDGLELLIAEFGMLGLGIVVRLFQRIYGKEGYYIEWHDDVAVMFAKNNQVGVNWI